jgi:hypothetical protein
MAKLKMLQAQFDLANERAHSGTLPIVCCEKDYMLNAAVLKPKVILF